MPHTTATQESADQATRKLRPAGQLLTAQQAAEIVYGVSERQFHSLREQGLVPVPVVLGPRSLRWVRAECEKSLVDLPRLVAAQSEPAQLRRAKIERMKAGSAA